MGQLVVTSFWPRSSTKAIFQFLIVLSLPSLDNCHFSENLWFLLVEMVSEVKIWGLHRFCCWKCHCSEVLSADRARKCACVHMCIYIISACGCIHILKYLHILENMSPHQYLQFQSFFSRYSLAFHNVTIGCWKIFGLLCRQCTLRWASAEAGMPIGRNCSSSRNPRDGDLDKSDSGGSHEEWSHFYF